MCVLALNVGRELVVAANRDEFRGRPSAPPQVLEPGIFGGKDLEGGGTWLGVNDRGLFAAVTNRRAPTRGYSRGLVTLEALRCSTLGDVEKLVRSRLAEHKIGGFNLVAVMSGEGVCFHYDGTLRPVRLSPGVHVVTSNHDLDEDTAERRVVAASKWDEASLKRLVADESNCKHGEKFGTVSSTILGPGSFLYADGMPCQAEFRKYTIKSVSIG
jgi:uncharacterized protein with NRDE domain